MGLLSRKPSRHGAKAIQHDRPLKNGGIQRIRKEAAEAWLAENETRGSTIH
jgi:hypothetical protein